MKTECVDLNFDPSKEIGYLGSVPDFDLKSDFHPANLKIYARRLSKKTRVLDHSPRCDATIFKSDFQKKVNKFKVIWLSCLFYVCVLLSYS